MLALAACNQVLGLTATKPRNCWNAVATMHDEDGDGFTDDCDNCPADANPDQADADRDGESFESADDWSPESNSFIGLAGAWQAGDDEYDQTKPDLFAIALLEKRTYPSIEVVVGNIVLQNTTFGGGGLGVETTPGTVHGAFCTNGISNGTTVLQLELRDDNGNQIGDAKAPMPLSPDPAHLMLSTAPGMPATCTAFRDPSQPVTVTLDSATDSAGFVGIGTGLATASFYSVTVFALR